MFSYNYHLTCFHTTTLQYVFIQLPFNVFPCIKAKIIEGLTGDLYKIGARKGSGRRPSFRAVCRLFIVPPSWWPCGKVPALRVADPGFESRFLRSSHTACLKTGTLVASLQGGSRYRISSRTGWRAVNMLRLVKITNLISSFYVSVAAHQVV